MAQAIAISIVDDDEPLREALISLVRSEGYVARAFESGDSFLASDFRYETRCLLVDMHMPGRTGLELSQDLAASGIVIPTIIMTGRPDTRLQLKALGLGMAGYLAKPFTDEALLDGITLALGGSTPGRRA